ncbi:hypothetical protein JOL62DRAFT_623779 [Phyllosticta paracitricarpa]|uniref:SET domain-containing protein n=2 Tax=Phyllosticta TaxID=121621 RepID=A0ABR1MQM4_9PEZI
MSDQPADNATTLAPALQLLEEAVDLVASGKAGHATCNATAIQTLREVLSYVADENHDGRDVSRITLAVAVEGEEGRNHVDVLLALTPPDYEGDRDALFTPEIFVREPSEVSAASPSEPTLPTVPPPPAAEPPSSPSEGELAVEASTEVEDKTIAEPSRTATNLKKPEARSRNGAHFGCGQYLPDKPTPPPPDSNTPSPTTPTPTTTAAATALRNDLFYTTADGRVDVLRHQSPFHYTNTSRVDRSVWPNKDPRRQWKAHFYICDICVREQSEELDAPDAMLFCKCLAPLFSPPGGSDSGVQIVEVEPSTLGVQALRRFSGGSVLAEFAGLVTSGMSIEECPRNWTRYLRYTTCECSNVELDLVTWRGVEKVVVRVRNRCSIGEGDELMLAYV